ncbi:hypothetical protein [Streptomyces griseosporeus]
MQTPDAFRAAHGDGTTLPHLIGGTASSKTALLAQMRRLAS